MKANYCLLPGRGVPSTARHKAYDVATGRRCLGCLRTAEEAAAARAEDSGGLPVVRLGREAGDGATLQRCPQCYKAGVTMMYCGPGCQKACWQAHKSSCKERGRGGAGASAASTGASGGKGKGKDEGKGKGRR